MMKISIFRRWTHFHNEGLHSQFFHFLDIFWRSLHFFPQKNSSLRDQPFCFLAKNTLFIDIFQVAKYLLENICSLSTFEKGLRCFRPKMSAHCFFTFKHLYLLGTLAEKKHHIIWEFFPTWGGVFPIPKTFVNWPSVFLHAKFR